MTDDRDLGGRKRPWRLIADNSLSIALFSLFLACIAAQSLSGWRAYNDSLRAAHDAAVSYLGYIATGTFQNAIFSNWQAALLQLAVLISFSTVLRQRGAAHSRKSDDERRADDNREHNQKADDKGDRPARPSAASRRRLTVNLQLNPMRKRWLYNNSLSVVMFGLFLIAFVLHAWTSNRAYNEEQALRHLAPQALTAYLGSTNFWFNCFQTWEAEFFAIGLYILLSIFLRQERSPESKKTEADDDDTGDTNE
jgi:hypothetical protein